jgi:hypothetical protein
MGDYRFGRQSAVHQTFGCRRLHHPSVQARQANQPSTRQDNCRSLIRFKGGATKSLERSARIPPCSNNQHLVVLPAWCDPPARLVFFKKTKKVVGQKSLLGLDIRGDVRIGTLPFAYCFLILPFRSIAALKAPMTADATSKGLIRSIPLTS